MFDHRATGGGIVEAAAGTCCGCQRGVIRNPMRQRERHYCRAHDRYMCDDCALSFKVTGSHKSFKQVMDEYEAKVIHGRTG